MKLVVMGKNNKLRFNKGLEFFLYLIGYVISFMIVSAMFKTFVLGDEHKIIYGIISAIIVYLLNKTIKPILVTLTLPISAATLGLFYFVINSIILKITDLIMGNKLDFTNIWILLIIAVVISAIDLLIELIIIKPIIRRVKLNGKNCN